MNFHCLKLFAVNLAICAAAAGQVNDLAVFRTTNNFNDLNASRDAIGMTPGDIRITHTITDGSAPISFDFLTSDIYLQVISRVDGWTNFYRAAFETNELATVRWRVIGIQRGEYVLYSEITTGGDTYPIFWRNLTVTSSVSTAGATINLYDIGAANVTGAVGRFTDLYVEGNIDVGGSLEAIDTLARTSSVLRVGDTMTGPLTNEYGFFGNGAGLTNLPPASVASLNDIGDVGVAGAASGEVLQFDGAAWTNASTSGGLTAWTDGTGTTTQAGSYLRPIDSIATNFAIFAGTNGSLGGSIPDGTAFGGNALGAYSLDFGSVRSAATHVPSGQRNANLVAYRAINSASGGGNVVLGGGFGDTPTISGAGGGNVLIGGGPNTISAGSYNTMLSASGNNTISASGGGNVITASVGFNEITGAAAGSIIAAGYDNDITTGQAQLILGGRYNRLSGAAILGTGSSIISGYRTTNTVEGAVSIGHYVNGDHRGSFAYSGFDGTTTRWATAASNTAIWRVAGFGIGTNNPRERLHVDGMVQIIGVKIYASGTNLYLTDSATYTNLITTTPL